MIRLNQISNELSDAISMVFRDNKYVTKAINLSLKKHRNWDDERRGLFSDTLYDIVRYWRLRWYLFKKKPSLEKHDISDFIDLYLFYKEKRRWPDTDGFYMALLEHK